VGKSWWKLLRAVENQLVEQTSLKRKKMFLQEHFEQIRAGGLLDPRTRDDARPERCTLKRATSYEKSASQAYGWGG